ncbi:uncharacterized protein [Dermacentor albipictus]|uniref:uncharacterized protein n=1 Tax=Dermacentor albipictus TaxID=60249 RepID=UPI0038FD2295
MLQEAPALYNSRRQLQGHEDVKEPLERSAEEPMPKNQNTLPCNLDKKTRTTQDVHFSAPSQLPEVTRTQATNGTRLYHCSAAGIASTSGFATAVSQRQCLRNYWP